MFKNKKFRKTKITITTIILIVIIAFSGFKIAVYAGGRNVAPFNYKDNIQLVSASDVTNRFISLDNTANTRDIGGYTTQDGKTIKKGLIFRSDALTKLNNNDQQKLNSLHIKTDLDLREPSQFQDNPDHVPTSIKYESTPIFDEMDSSYLTLLLFQRDKLDSMMEKLYLSMIDTKADRFGTVLTKIADKENQPVIYHCSAGKDRAGITTALLLSLLGVDDNTIISDFSLSNENYPKAFSLFQQNDGKKLAEFGVPLDQLPSIIGVRPEWMKTTLQHIKEKYGSTENYLITQAKVSPETIQKLRTGLLQ